MYGRGAESSEGSSAEAIVGAEDKEADAEDESDDDGSEEEDGNDEHESKTSRSFKPPQRGSTLPAEIAEDDEETADIKKGIRAQLLGWANDPGMPLDEQKRCVRQLLAQWHPDKNRHIGSVATRVFQFIQEEVSRIVSSIGEEADKAARKEAEARERKAQRSAEKSAKAAALEAARREKRQKQRTGEEEAAPDVEDEEDGRHHDQEWSLVIGHGPATAAFLRPWPRSHFSLLMSPVAERRDELLLFGGEAYDGRELTFYSDLYRLDMGKIEDDVPLPWEKLYSAVPMIPGPEARSAHQALAWDKYLYVFGGEWSSRDQKRYRQFSDLWRFDASGRPGTRWERIEASGAVPEARSGHRMALAPGGHAVMFGGFTEDKKRRATYLDDLQTLHLPSHTWRSVPKPGDRRAARPGARSGGLLFAMGSAIMVYGGSRPVKKGADALQVMDDLWKAQLSSDGAVVWEQLKVDGSGPGKRSGLCHCALARDDPGRRLVFGGVADHRVMGVGSGGASGSKARAAAEVSVFHQDVFLLDCSAALASEGRAHWTRLWPPPGGGMPAAPLAAPRAEDLPAELLKKGGGADAQTLALVSYAGRGGKAARPADAAGDAPRGRMAAGCVVSGGSLWIFGGSCESGPKQEVTLDDLWRLDLHLQHEEGHVQVSCGERWQCVLPLSDRATVWFDDSDSDSDEEEEEESAPGAAARGALLETSRAGGGVLSKKQEKEEAKRARMELKRERQAEKCEEKTSKRELKKERQRQQAKQ
eukprot:TRINITY_DN27193_c0_g1_i1.p1 TRINITY_DN27193_c0_g1~~TRINITY_DN27193_c0_g1_i1.p1  ORF type:complete len:824 (+),score=211.59 TRINITY_DN27193_c0_g1_i1:199-2472(+)